MTDDTFYGSDFGALSAFDPEIAGVLTSELVGTIGVSIEDRFWFTGPVFYGDTITFDVWIAEKREENRTIIWQASARNTDGLEVLKAEATLKFPRKKPAAA